MKEIVNGFMTLILISDDQINGPQTNIDWEIIPIVNNVK